MSTPSKPPSATTSSGSGPGPGTPQYALSNVRSLGAAFSENPAMFNAAVLAIGRAAPMVAGSNPLVASQPEKITLAYNQAAHTEEIYNQLKQQAAADALVQLPDIKKIQAEAGHTIDVAAQGGMPIEQAMLFGDRDAAQGIRTAMGVALVEGASTPEHHPQSSNSTPNFAEQGVLGHFV